MCNRIALKNHKLFLSKEKKYALTRNYIAIDYLNKMELKSLGEIKNNLIKNSKNISFFNKDFTSLLTFASLNDFYKLYNDYIEFKKLLNNKENNNDEDVLKGFSIVFDIGKIANPLYYAALYDMQYMFWNIVVIGGLFADMELSAYLMRISLTNSGEYGDENNILIIEDENVSNTLFENEEFKDKINDLLKEYNTDIKEKLISFSGGDLLLSLHNATLNLKASKKENGNWDLMIEIIDKYDFTDIKDLKDYVTSTDSIMMSISSSTLNNFAAISSSYNVIKPFNFKIIIKNDDYKIENIK